MPDIFYESLDAVPEGLREHAKEENDKIVVKVVPQSKLDEFRENNINLAKERDELSKFKATAAEILGTDDFETAQKELETLRTTARRVKDGELVENKGLEEALGERTKQMREGYEEENKRLASDAKAWKDKYSQTDLRLRRTFVDRAVTDAVLDEGLGVHPKALPDILGRAYSVFEVGDDGKLTPKRGDAVIYGADGSSPMSPKEWVQSLKDEAPYFFKNSSGGGSNGGDGKNFNGYSSADLAKMSPEQRLAIANGEHQRG